MKKHLISLLALLTASVSFGASLNADVANEAGLAYSKTYAIDLNENDISRVAVQVIHSTTVFSTATVTDGGKSVGNITVSNAGILSALPATNAITLAATNALQAVQATNRITILSTSSIAGKDIVFRGITYREGRDWSKGSSVTQAAANLAAVLNTATGIDASSSAGVVYATATRSGYYENAYTLTSNTTNVVVLNPTFTGGQDRALLNSWIEINGKKLREGYEWSEQSTSSGTAAAIATILNKVAGIEASASGSVIYATATTAGTAGNAYTLAASTSAFTLGSSTFSGGRDAATLTIGGVTLRANVDFVPVATASGTAKAISDAIMANPVLSSAIASTWTVQGIVYATSTAIGDVNYSLADNTTGLSLSGAAMTGGSASAFTLNSSLITIPSHGFTLGLPVWFSTASAFGISPLSHGTTYYVAPIDANTIAIATTSARAISGNYVTITSSSAAGPHTFRFTPSVWAGSASFKWQVSNDGENFSDISGTSVNVTPSITPTSTYSDLGVINGRYLRLNVTGPTAGGLKIRANVNGRKE